MELGELAKPLEFPGGAILRNRLCKSALAEGLSGPDGNPNSALDRLYRRWSEGGAGLLITGNAHVDRRFRERPTSLIIDSKSDRAAYRSLAAAGKSGGASIWLQLNHPGRQCPKQISRHPVGPVALPPTFRFSGYSKARPLALTEIPDLIASFVTAAQVAADCGFDGIQIHAAHGYLLSSFLSPNLNRRDDDYGYDLAGRARLLLEIVSAVRVILPSPFIISVKINATDFERDGLEPDEAEKIAGWCAAAGADCIEVSGGSYRRMAIAGEAQAAVSSVNGSCGTGYFRAFASSLAAQIRTPIMLTGGVRDVGEMSRAVKQNGIALIGLGRPMCVDTDIAKKILSGEVLHLDHLAAPPSIGPGILSRNSIYRRIRRFNAFTAQAWYGEQLYRAARGLPPDTGLGAWRALRLMTARDHAYSKSTAP